MKSAGVSMCSYKAQPPKPCVNTKRSTKECKVKIVRYFRLSVDESQ